MIVNAITCNKANRYLVLSNRKPREKVECKSNRDLAYELLQIN